MKDKDTLKLIRSGLRLVVPPPKREIPKTVYTRKSKHPREWAR